MNRKLLVVVAVAAVLALLAGAAVGRNLLSSQTSEPTAGTVLFEDEVADISIAYPATWRQIAGDPSDPDVALRAAADPSTSLLVRVSAVGLDAVTKETLPIVRKFTDDLLSEDSRLRQLVDPIPVELGGLPGWRYRYVYGSGDSAGAHDHYFLFKGARMIQLVFQAMPPSRLPELASVFDSIAETFKGRRG